MSNDNLDIDHLISNIKEEMDKLNMEELQVNKEVKKEAKSSELPSEQVNTDSEMSSNNMSSHSIEVKENQKDAIKKDDEKNVVISNESQKELISKESVANEPVSKESVANAAVSKESVANDTVSKESVANDAVSKELVANDAVSKELVANDKASKESVANDEVSKESVSKEDENKKINTESDSQSTKKKKTGDKFEDVTLESLKISKEDLYKKTPISFLHEICLKKKVRATYTSNTGGEMHCPVFTTKCKAGRIIGVGEGKCKKVSRQHAAQSVLAQLLDVDKDSFQIPDYVKKEKKKGGKQEIYTCRPCVRQIESDLFANHVLAKRHLVKMNRKCNWNNVTKCCIRVSGYKKESELKVVSYFIESCKVVNMYPETRCCNMYIWFEDDATAAEVAGWEHMVDEEMLQVSVGGPPLFDQFWDEYPLISDVEIINSMSKTMTPNEIEDFIEKLTDEVEMKPENMAKLNSGIERLSDCVKPYFPNVQTHMHGACLNGTAFYTADLKVYVDLGIDYLSNEHDIKDLSDTTEFLAKIIKESEIGFGVYPTKSNTYPVVQYFDSEHRFEVVIKLKDMMPVASTKLIKAYVDKSPKLRRFIIFLTYWAKVQGICRGGNPWKYISNYPFSLLCLFFLMYRKIIPCVYDLQKLHREKDLPQNIIDGWDFSFDPNDITVDEEQLISIFPLAKEFFNFYSTINFRRWVMCPYTAEILDGKDLLKKDKTKFPNMEKFCESQDPFSVSFINMQDTFHHTTNVLCLLYPDYSDEFKERCLIAHDVCRGVLGGMDPIREFFTIYYTRTQSYNYE